MSIFVNGAEVGVPTVSSVTTLSATVAADISNLTTLSGRVTTASGTISGVRTDVTTLSATTGGIRTAVTTLSGRVTTNSGVKGLVISGAPAVEDWSGTVVSMTVISNSVGYGALLTTSGGGNYVMANSTTSAAMPCLAIAIEAGTGTKNVLLNGFISKTGWTWTRGTLYVDTTNGVMTQTAPSTSANVVQAVGYAFTATKIFFNPDLITIEVA